MNEYLYSRQDLLFCPDKHQVKVYIYGIGSIGSNLCFTLAKLGIENITVYDFDTVELGNVPAQMFQLKHNGMLKVNAMADLISETIGTTITPVNVKIDDSFMPEVVDNSIHFILMDNMETSLMLFHKLEGYNLHILDARIGGFQLEKYYVNGRDTRSHTKYAGTMTGTFTELQCGEKACYPVNAILSGMLTADVIQIAKGKIPDYCVKTDIMSRYVIRQEKVKE